MLSRQNLPTRAPALYLLLGMIAGLCAARQVAPPVGLALGIALALTALSLGCARRRSRLWLFSFLAAASLAAWAYGSLRLPDNPDPAQLELPVREAKLRFEVERVMQARNPYDKATGIARILEASPTSRLTRGDRVFFRLKLPEGDPFEVLRGSELRATGVLEPIPQTVEPDSFEAYLKVLRDF